jgi:2',3'-cyclic-nucleotide 2'-phosphodiesterase (5'-nucleotidase family)
MPADKLKIAGELVPYRFHNKEVLPHPKVNAIYEQEWLPKMLPFFKNIVQNEIHLMSATDRETELANLVTTLMHDAVPDSDFVIINPGGLRTEWFPGWVQYQHFYNMFPFNNFLVSFEISGS